MFVYLQMHQHYCAGILLLLLLLLMQIQHEGLVCYMLKHVFHIFSEIITRVSEWRDFLENYRVIRIKCSTRKNNHLAWLRCVICVRGVHPVLSFTAPRVCSSRLACDR